ncbi:MAG: MerR family transcriptional regulator [Pseudomonadota bacterium]
MKEGEIPFIQVGAHRRVQFADVMAYKEKRDAMRKKALKEMADFGQMFDAQ